MPDLDTRFFTAVSPRIALGVSTDTNAAAVAGEAEISGLVGFRVRDPSFELALTTDIFIVGRTPEGSMATATTIGGGAELAVMPMTSSRFFNPVVRLGVGGGVTVGRDGDRPAARVSLEGDIPILATHLDTGAWATVGVSYIGDGDRDNDLRFTLGFRFALPTVP